MWYAWYFCTQHLCTHVVAHTCPCVFPPACLAGCHVAHLLLSSCLTLGLSWISLGPRWQRSRQHHFASRHMGRLQGNRAVSVSSVPRGLLWHTSAHTDGVSALQTMAYSTCKAETNTSKSGDAAVIWGMQTHIDNMLIMDVCDRKYKYTASRKKYIPFFYVVWKRNYDYLHSCLLPDKWEQILNGCCLRVFKDSLTLFIVVFFASFLDMLFFFFCSYLYTWVYSFKALTTTCPSYVLCR